MALTETRKLRYIQRQGRYHYFRHPLLKLARGKGRLPGKEGSPQYLTEYYRLLARAEHGAPRAEGERPDRVTFRTGSVGWVALAFAGDSEFGLPTRKPGTRRAYLRMIDVLRDDLPADKRHGSNIAHVPIAGMDREHVKAHCRAVQEKLRSRSRADHQQLILSVLFQYADEHLPQCKLSRIANPARGRKRGYKPRARLPWTPDVLRRFLGDGCPPHLRLAAGILFYTGQRRGDVCKMRWSDYNGSTLVIDQEKTGEHVELTVHRELRKLLMSAPRTCEFIVTTRSGRAYDGTRLSKDIQARLKEIGQPAGKFVLHGLRKSAAVYLAHKGATSEMLMRWFGWRSAAMAHYYVKQAEAAKLNKQTAALWDAA